MKNEDKTFGYRGDRVRAQTAAHVNRMIDEKTKKDIQVYSGASADAIQARIRELEQEWDIERVLQMNASLLSLIGLGLGVRFDKRWLAIPFAVLPFLLLHAVQGWCPPIPLLRRLGIRTQREIEAEKYALKSLQKIETSQTPSRPAHLSVGI